MILDPTHDLGSAAAVYERLLSLSKWVRLIAERLANGDTEDLLRVAEQLDRVADRVGEWWCPEQVVTDDDALSE